MLQLVPSADIDELRHALRESEQRRQAAETRLADRERRLGMARKTIAAQDDEIAMLTAELNRRHLTVAPPVHDDFMSDAIRFFNVYSSSRKPA